jgi:hypothetical protein
MIRWVIKRGNKYFHVTTGLILNTFGRIDDAMVFTKKRTAKNAIVDRALDSKCKIVKIEIKVEND